jgi:hypothetical protein
MSIKQNANMIPLLEVIYVFRAWVEVNEYKATDVFWLINIEHTATKASLIKKRSVPCMGLIFAPISWFIFILFFL